MQVDQRVATLIQKSFETNAAMVFHAFTVMCMRECCDPYLKRVGTVDKEYNQYIIQDIDIGVDFGGNNH